MCQKKPCLDVLPALLHGVSVILNAYTYVLSMVILIIYVYDSYRTKKISTICFGYRAWTLAHSIYLCSLDHSLYAFECRGNYSYLGSVVHPYDKFIVYQKKCKQEK